MDIQKLKAELIEEILDTIHEELSSMNACASGKAKADETAGKAVNAVNEGEAVNEGAEMPVEEKAKPETVEEIKEGAGAAETAETAETAAEVKEQTAEEKVEKPAEEKKAEEVIKIETLNSSPAKPTLAPQPEAWRSMSQKDFINWIESGAYRK